MIQEGDNILVTTDNWFYAPDGRKYRAAGGKMKVHEDSDILGVKTNRNSTDWYLTLGEGGGAILVAGCQVHYAVVCPDQPSTEDVIDVSYGGGEMMKKFMRPTEIYIANPNQS